MSLDILLTISVTAFIQSVFGVGVLLFGTPVLLALGYDFIDAIYVLLPVSVMINVLQIIKDHNHINFKFYKDVTVYTVPCIIASLFFITHFKINIGLFIGIFLLFVAIKDYFSLVKNFIDKAVRYERIYFIMMGIIHGLTNLGGSLLTAIVYNTNTEKRVIRATIAATYATFAIFQILTLVFANNSTVFNLKEIGLYTLVGVVIFLLSEAMVYMEINNEKYQIIFSLFLFCSGILLCLKAL